MAPSQEPPTGSASQNPRAQGTPASNMAQAYRDLDRGELTAQLIEARLDLLESHLDAVFADFEAMGKYAESDEEDKKKPKPKDGGKEAAKPPSTPPAKGGVEKRQESA